MIDIYLISNPGSNTRKYSIYSGDKEILKFFFDPIGNPPECYVTNMDGIQETYSGFFKPTMEDCPKAMKKIIDGYHPEIKIKTILIRIVATGDYFVSDHIVDDECIGMLERSAKRTPLHAPIALNEIHALKEAFPSAKIALISDSSFHASRLDISKYYAINTDVADKYQIKRYGAHGLSMEWVVRQMRAQGILPEKLVVCHIGSGASVSAIMNGKSFETTMGYTPLEGVVMATRSGDIDPAAALALKRALNLSDEGLEEYLNKKCGLFGLSGLNDFRDVYARKDEDERCNLAYRKFIYQIRQGIGKMIASMNGADALVLTATICERQANFRRDLAMGLSCFGFEIDDCGNEQYHYFQNVGLVSKEGSKPVYVIPTNETAEMLAHARKLL